jgi:hypothetical protein
VSLAIELVTLLVVKPSGSFLWLLVRLIRVPELSPRRELASLRGGTCLNSSSEEIVRVLLGGVIPLRNRECCRRIIVSSVLCYYISAVIISCRCRYLRLLYILLRLLRLLSPPTD